MRWRMRSAFLGWLPRGLQMSFFRASPQCQDLASTPLVFHQTFSQIGVAMANSRGPLMPAAQNLNFGGLLIGLGEAMMTGALDARVVYASMQRLHVLRQ